MSELYHVLRSRFFVDFEAPEADLNGRVCLITGANTGVGYEAALHLAKRNASIIILGVRTLSKGEDAAKKISEDCPSFRGKIHIWELDMANFKSVIAFGKKCKTELERLDIVILNAGMTTGSYKATEDGWEEILQVNVLSTGLLSLLLLPKLASSADPSKDGVKPHLTVVSSDVQYMAAFKQRTTHGSLLDALNDPKQFSLDTYNVSKLLDMYIVREMANLRMASGIVINAVNPGLTTSGLRKDLPYPVRLIFDTLAWPTEKGSRNYIYAVLTDTTPAAFVYNCEERAPATMVTSPEGQDIQKKFWAESTALWKSLAPQVAEVL